MNWIVGTSRLDDRVHEAGADARVVEHVLDDHDAAGQVEEVEPDHLDRGSDRVRQCVHQDDPPVWERPFRRAIST